MFSEKGMKPDPEKIHEIRETPAPEDKKSLTKFSRTDHLREKIYIRLQPHKYITYDNYHRMIKITYQKHLSKLLTILNNLLVVKVVFPILTTRKRHLFAQTLVLTEFRRSLCKN